MIGLFCLGQQVSDGQSIKTRMVAQELSRALGPENLLTVDTFGWKKHPHQLLLGCFRAVREAEHILFLTDAGGIRVFPWLLLGLGKLYGKKIHYSVIGGWLVNFLGKHPFLTACLRRLDTVFVETAALERGLRGLGFQNVHLLPNFKDLTCLREEELVTGEGEPYGFCTLSRVMEEKGIADAVKAIQTINRESRRTVATLDIYGSVDPAQREWFRKLSSEFPEGVRYCGVVPYDRTVEVLKGYHALLFPTHYATEGIPGTVIDAYAAGVPVIAARWEGFRDIVEHGRTGLGYPMLDQKGLTGRIREAVQFPEGITAMKKYCLKKAEDYLPSTVMDTLLKEMGVTQHA